MARLSDKEKDDWWADAHRFKVGDRVVRMMNYENPVPGTVVVVGMNDVVVELDDAAGPVVTPKQFVVHEEAWVKSEAIRALFPKGFGTNEE